MISRPRIGSVTQHHVVLDSTNTQAARFADDPANHGLVVTAGWQSAGRGQYERVWQAPAGLSVLMSVLVFPPLNLRRPAILTAWAATAACETIETATGLRTAIKWPNDILMDDAKVCGILCEAGAQHVVAGIGLNVNQSESDFVAAGLPAAASLALKTGRTYPVDEVAKILIERLDEGYDRLMDGRIDSLAEAWRQRIGLIDYPVRIEQMNGESMFGHLRRLQFDQLELEAADGGRLVLPPEAVRHMRRLIP